MATSPPLASASRSEARPVLMMSKKYEPPPRPKPGRKPDPEPAASKKASNRQSQRAFRERRNDYIAELESKVRVLSKGEGERAVFFQNCAVKAKAENDELRAENEQLKAEVAQLKQALAATGPSRRTSAPPEETVRRFRTSSTAQPDERPDAQELSKLRRNSLSSSSSSNRSAIPTTPGGRPVLVNPILMDVVDAEASLLLSNERPPTSRSYSTSTLELLGTVDPCGMCSREECYCETVGFKVSKRPASSSSDASSTEASAAKRPKLAPPTPGPAFDADEGAIQAVPLRLRRADNGEASRAKPNVWYVTKFGPEPPQPAVAAVKVEKVDKSKAVCNGDPSTCPACADDPQNQAFCNALADCVCSSNPCATCPSAAQNRPATALPAIVEDVEAERERKDERRGSEGEMPCNEAWEKLKSHPQIGRANLNLLAEVISQRTHCDGPAPVVKAAPIVPAGPAAPSIRSPPSTALASSHLPKNSHITLPGVATLTSRPASGNYYNSPVGLSSRGAQSPGGRRLTVEREAVRAALDYLDRSVGKE